jgi:YD repeat-containing protein
MAIGYKGTDNYSCRGKLYEIGKEYKMDKMPIICVQGFHYCENAKDVLVYYPYCKSFKLLEIENLGDIDYEIDKYCSNHIRVVREITDPDELIKLLGVYKTFNESGCVLTSKKRGGKYVERTYDECDRLLTNTDSTGYSQKYTYDHMGRTIAYESSTGDWFKASYDDHGRIIKHVDSNGYWYERTYDYDGTLLSQKSSFFGDSNQ